MDAPIDTKELSSACLVEDGHGICLLTKIGHGDHATPLGVASSVDQFEKFITADDENDEASRVLTQLTSFFPVRHKLSNYLEHMRGMLPWDQFKVLVLYETRDPGHLNKLLTEEATELFKEYTGSKGASIKLNRLLATDLISPTNLSEYAKKLKACVGWQTPKWQGKVYRAAWHSPLEIFMMAFKKCFYIPSFITTCIDPDSLDFEVWDDAKCDLRKNFHNVLLEIDTSAYPNFSTILQPSQSDRYYACKESLISCYNIFEWVGYKLVKIWVDLDSENERQIEVPMVSLRISDYENVNDLENHRVKGPSSPIPEEWILGRAAALKSRETGPSQLNKNFQDLIGSYARNGGKQYPLDWLKANFSGSEEIRQQGLELDGPLFADLVKKQEEMRETGSKPQ